MTFEDFYHHISKTYKLRVTQGLFYLSFLFTFDKDRLCIFVIASLSLLE